MSGHIQRLVLCSTALSVFATSFAFATNAKNQAAAKSVKAQKPSSVVQAAKSIQQIAAELTQQPPASTSVLSLPERSQSEINACIESTCGPAKWNWGAFDVLNSRKTETVTFKNLWETELASQVEMAERLPLEADVREAEAALAMAKKGVTLTEAELAPLRVLINFGRLSNSGKLNKVFAASVVVENGAIQKRLDDAKFEAVTATESANEKRALRLVIEKVYFKALDLEASSPVVQNKLKKYLKNRYPGEPLKVALKKDAAQLNDNRLAIEKHVGSNVIKQDITIEDLELIQEAMAGNDLTQVESDRYLEAATILNVAAALYTPEVESALSALPLDMDSILTHEKLMGAIEKKKSEAQEKIAQNAAELVKAKCRSSLSVALAAEGSGLKTSQTIEAIHAVKAAAKRILPRFATESIRKPLEKEIDATDFVLPERSARKLARFRAEVQHTISLSQARLKDISQGGSEFERMLKFNMVVTASGAVGDSAKSDSNEKPKAKGLEATCNSLQPDTVSDFAVTALGKISVSWYTVAYPDVGIAILAHELGHVVSAELRPIGAVGPNGLGFNQSLTCVANRNPFLLETKEWKGSENSTWSEEDWADHFSSLVLNELEKDPKWRGFARNKACALVVDAGDTYGYSFMPNEMKPYQGDSHSSGFLRLLFIAQDRDELTPTCRPFLNDLAQAGREPRCE